MVPGSGMPPDRANRIADAVEDIEQNVARLRDDQQLSRSEYTAAENYDLRNAVERKFEKLAEATLDIAEEICKQERGAAPDRRKAKITALEGEGIISADVADRLREAAGFRDVLSHSYGPIVNDDLVYDALQTSLDRYVDFVEAIEVYLSGMSEE